MLTVAVQAISLPTQISYTGISHFRSWMFSSSSLNVSVMCKMQCDRFLLLFEIQIKNSLETAHFNPVNCIYLIVCKQAATGATKGMLWIELEWRTASLNTELWRKVNLNCTCCSQFNWCSIQNRRDRMEDINTRMREHVVSTHRLRWNLDLFTILKRLLAVTLNKPVNHEDNALLWTFIFTFSSKFIHVSPSLLLSSHSLAHILLPPRLPQVINTPHSSSPFHLSFSCHIHLLCLVSLHHCCSVFCLPGSDWMLCCSHWCQCAERGGKHDEMEKISW